MLAGEREAEDSRPGLRDRTHRLWRSRRDFHSQPGGSAILLSHFSRVKVLLSLLTRSVPGTSKPNRSLFTESKYSRLLVVFSIRILYTFQYEYVKKYADHPETIFSVSCLPCLM